MENERFILVDANDSEFPIHSVAVNPSPPPYTAEFTTDKSTPLDDVWLVDRKEGNRDAHAFIAEEITPHGIASQMQVRVRGHYNPAGA